MVLRKNHAQQNYWKGALAALTSCPVAPEDINNIVFRLIIATTDTLNLNFFL